jgi:hypothetical protein
MPISSILFIYTSKLHQINIIPLLNTTIMQIQAIILLFAATVSAWVRITLSMPLSTHTNS